VTEYRRRLKFPACDPFPFYVTLLADTEKTVALGERHEGPFRLGEVVGDTFRIVSVLGEGGFATVYGADDLQLGRRVAVKASKRRHDTLQPEAQALAALHHPGVVQVFFYGTHDGYAYIVMEHLRGVALNEVLERRRSRGALITVTEVVHWAGSIADTLAFTHARGLVHRDVKPGNIMLCPDGRVVLVDFGLFLPRAQSERGFSGTIPYVPPEAMADGLACPARDIYALGVTIYELLTSELPFEDSDPLVCLSHAANDEVPALRARRADVPTCLATLVAEMLDKDPSARPDAASTGYRLAAASELIRHKREQSTFRVLVVDDDESIVRLLTTYLRAYFKDCVVEGAYSADAALAKIREAPPDVLLLDLNMPATNGVELLMHLRGSALAQDCMVVAVSAAAQPPDVELLRRLGAHHFIPKGARLLDRVVQRVVEQRFVVEHMVRSTAA
jgi:serine/threonine-protein kinase